MTESSYAALEAQMERLDLNPNCFMSDEYFRASGWRVEEDDGVVLVRASDDALIMPPVGPEGIVSTGGPFWASHLEKGPEPKVGRVLLDHQYLYDPRTFEDLSGGARKVFRKNVRQFQEAHGFSVSYESVNVGEALQVVVRWLETLQAAGIALHDSDTIIKYMGTEATSARCWGLFVYGELRAVNVWDSNWKYINFRYCFTDGTLECLSEFARLQFYLRNALPRGKLVNDGGDLGSESLARFKRKLGPHLIHHIYTEATL